MFMLNLLLLFVVGYVIGRMIGGRIGYLKGKAQVTEFISSDPPDDDDLTKELVACERIK